MAIKFQGKSHGRQNLVRIWYIILTMILTGLSLAVVATFIPIAVGFVGYSLGFVVPLASYFLFDKADWHGHFLALAAVLVSGVLAGLFHSILCGFVQNLVSSASIGQIDVNCKADDISATYFAGFYFPLLPAAMIVLMVWYSNRHTK